MNPCHEEDGLRRLSLQGFRHLRDDALELDPRVNVIQGANAAGKTSFLESIHFLARARSFLTHRTAQMVAKGKERALVHGQIRAAGADHRLGVQYQKGQTRVRLDGRDVQALSESAGLLPIQVINTEGQRLLTDGPAERRAFLNWGVFHVEPAYREDWRRYQKALRQRNAALRAGDRRLVAAWEPAMVAAAEAVDRRRQAFLETLMPRAMAIATNWLPASEPGWHFRRGWKADCPLAEVLAEGREQELSQGFALYGPQRADLRLTANGTEAEARLSRGQQKLLVAALRIALVEQWASRGTSRPLVLVDDLPAELDAAHRRFLLSSLLASGAQVFLTTIESEQLPGVGLARWFHVEHGWIRSV